MQKSSLRAEVLGTLDELNSALGWARAAGLSEEVEGIVDRVQAKLVGLMGELACLPEDVERYREKGFDRVEAGDVEWLESEAENFEDRDIRFTGWARPGADGTLARAGLDFARSIARRAERRTWELHESEGPISVSVRLYFNRLSDLLWLMARAG
nr:ATP:cob(I)alamin adenosyltransferase [Haloferula luteola]